MALSRSQLQELEPHFSVAARALIRALRRAEAYSDQGVAEDLQMLLVELRRIRGPAAGRLGSLEARSSVIRRGDSQITLEELLQSGLG